MLLLGQWEGVSERSLCRNGFTPVKMAPKSPRKSPRCPETACPTMSSGLQEVQPQPSGMHCGWGHPGTSAPTGITSWAGGRQVCVPPPETSSTPSYCGWHGEDLASGEQVWTVLWSARHPPATTAQLEMREEQLGTYVIHKTYQKKNCHNNFY